MANSPQPTPVAPGPRAPQRRPLRALPAPRGSVTLITLTFIIILATAGGFVLERAATNYRLTMRNQLRAEARAIGESEMEYIYYKFKQLVLSGNAPDAAPNLATDTWENSSAPSTAFSPFYSGHRNAGWTVKRGLVLDRAPVTGRIPGTTKVGTYTYLIARVEVIPPATHPFRDIDTVRIGRRFINSNTSIFQYSVFFQGNLELNPGTDTVINGDIIANGSIYMGPMSGRTLTINNKVRYLADQYFNQTSGGVTTYSNPTAPAPPVTLVAPTFATSQAAQVETLGEQENLLGGIDATATAQGRPDLFGPAGNTNPATWTAGQLAAAENNVYRSIVVPPPNAAASTEYPNASGSTGDDSVIAVQRAYNRAQLIITVETSGTTTFTKVVEGVSTNVTALFTGVAAAPTNVRDLREGVDVKMTNINVSTLKTFLDSYRALTPADANYFNFNGILYVNLKSSTATAPAAIRLVNATAIPANGNAGFSVATNGGLYVQGNYNTDNLIAKPDGTFRPIPAMLIADAITVLSSNWSDANASGTLAVRQATSGTTTVNAGLLTGNVPSTTTSTSGGVQNLVRYLEDWSGRTVAFYGSLGRLFTSTNFDAPYGGAGTIYNIPNRTFTFDTNMLENKPPGSPTTTAFSRGSFFTW